MSSYDDHEEHVSPFVVCFYLLVGILAWAFVIAGIIAVILGVLWLIFRGWVL